MQLGRVFLAGDSAHIHSPAGGQGMNTGLQDAYNLAWKLAFYEKGLAKRSLVDSYHDERYPVIKQIVSLTHRATKLIGLRNRLLQWMRNYGLSKATQYPMIQKRMVNRLSQVKLNYHLSPLVAQHWPLFHSSGLMPGSALIDFGFTQKSTNQTVCLFELFKDMQYVLLFLTGIKHDHFIKPADGELIVYCHKNLSALMQVYIIADAGNPLTYMQAYGPDILLDFNNKFHHQIPYSTRWLCSIPRSST